jgi:hypothetical protein
VCSFPVLLDRLPTSVFMRPRCVLWGWRPEGPWVPQDKVKARSSEGSRAETDPASPATLAHHPFCHLLSSHAIPLTDPLLTRTSPLPYTTTQDVPPSQDVTLVTSVKFLLHRSGDWNSDAWGHCSADHALCQATSAWCRCWD